MADPLSIASGVAGLVSLGLTLCGGLHNYLSSVNGRHQDIESASRSLTLLQSNIFIVQSSTLKLGHRHALSANGVNQALANCEFELVALQQLMLNLTRDEGLTDMKGRMRKQMMIARYPFDQKKLIQLQDQLSKANAILSSFVQSFNLDVNIGISEDLRVLKNYTNANDSMTHNMLRTIARRLDTISPTVQRSQMEVATISPHIQEYCLSSGSHVSSVSVQPRYVQNSQRETSLIKELNEPKCTCSDPRPTYIHRKSSYVNRSWGKWVISREERKRQSHRPGCMFLSQSLQTSKITWSYLGFRYWLSRSLSLSFTRDYPAGAYSLSFGIQACYVVKSSPAFEAITELRCAYAGVSTNWASFIMGDHPTVWLRENISDLLKRLRTIYTSRCASPFDVDENGRNIAHKFMELHRENLIPYAAPCRISFEDLFEVTRSFLLHMFELGVPITASSFYQETIMENIWRTGSLGWLPQWYHFITTLDTSFDFCIKNNIDSNVTYGSYLNLSQEDFQVWAKYPEIAEAFGFNNIFRAVMQRDRQKLEIMTIGDQQTSGLLETDVYGRNILHASITWPAGLDLLLQQSQVLSLVHNSESNSACPLQFAIWYSGSQCTQADKWAICSDCDCAVPVQQLLETDCCVLDDYFDPISRNCCSFRCLKLLFEHLEDRRRRLRDLSLAILPSDVIERYGVAVDSIPYATAVFMWEELQSRSEDWGKQGYRISGGLKPSSPKCQFGGIFERLLSPEICSLLTELEMRPCDEGSLRPLLARVTSSYTPKEKSVATYLNWLMKHDLELEYVANGFQTSVLHDWGGPIGRSLREMVHRPILEAEVISLIARICTSDIGSNLPCPCVSGPFNRPLASLISGFSAYDKSRLLAPRSVGTIGDVCLLVDLLGSIASNVDASYLARCAVHAITMELLGIRHVGPCAWIGGIWGAKVLDENERLEVLDEDSSLLEKLGNLDEEFAREFERRNESVVDFLRGHYTERMEEVVKEMDAPLGDDYKRGLLAAGVVLAEPK